MAALVGMAVAALLVPALMALRLAGYLLMPAALLLWLGGAPWWALAALLGGGACFALTAPRPETPGRG